MKPPLRHGSPDDFQTPPEALAPLLPYLNKEWTIWECAMGKGYLVDELRRLGYKVVGTDILTGTDFITAGIEADCIITTPPYKYKQEFLERCYSLGKPFALLMPLTALETGKRQRLYKQHGLEMILFDKRINLETPNKIEKSSSWFASAWYTNGLNIGTQLTFAELK